MLNYVKRLQSIICFTGTGGAGLYDTAFSNKPKLWEHQPRANWIAFTDKFISHIHSFSEIKTSGKTLTFRQLDVKGVELDKIEIKK